MRTEPSILSLIVICRAWDEIQEVFGDGHDYDHALESDTEGNEKKKKPTIRDIFEPAEIAERMMTDADDIIRALDIPERMQVAQAGLTVRAVPTGADGQDDLDQADCLLRSDEIPDAAIWVRTRISDRITAEFVSLRDGMEPPLLEPFTAAVEQMLTFLCIEFYEVPFIWVHRRDFFIHHDPNAFKPTDRSIALLTREDLWKIRNLAIKYRAIVDRKDALQKMWEKLNVDDLYYNELYNAIESVEEASDLVEYVTVKYSRELKALAQLAGADLIPEDAEAEATRNGSDGAKLKRATSVSRYERAKNSLVARFAEVGYAYERI